MPTMTGWVTSEKRSDDRGGAQHTSISPSGEDKWAHDIAIKGTVYELERDQAEAGSTTIVINATAHNARPKDLIRFTSGAAINYEAYVYETTANTITLWNDIPVAPAASDEFAILRSVTLTLGADGSFSGPVKFVLDGGIVDVTEDTVTPANNLPLPVKLTSVTGDINITANDLNVQLSHSAATPDSTQIGDGTEIMLINASGEAQVADDTARTSLAAIETDTGVIAADTTSIDASIDVALSTRASEVTLAAAEVHLGNIDTATASLDTDIDVALSTRASEVTAAAILADTAAIDTATTSIDSSIDVNLSTVATEVTAAAILADTANIDTSTASIDSSINVNLSTRASEATATAILADTANIDTTTGLINTQVSAINTSTAAIDTTLDVDLSTRASEVTAAAILADTAIMSAWDTGSGAVSANTQRVELTTESLAALENITVEIDPLTVVDTFYNDASSSNIPGNATAPLEITASAPSDVKKVQFLDTMGFYLELMTGAAASEVRVAVIGPGSDQTLELDITTGTRISVRRLDGATALTEGSLAINFIG